LAIDLGSSSKKYGLFRGETEVVRVRIEKNDATQLNVTMSRGQKDEHSQWPAEDYPHAIKRVLEWLVDEKLVANLAEIETVGLRIVAPGQKFAVHQPIDTAFISALRQAALTAPLHITAVLDELSELKEQLPHARLMAASDSAFHTTLPQPARRYAIPEALAQRYDLYRTGYHGLSIESVLRQLRTQLSNLPKRIIVCHLGSGASISAILDGQSVDTSMGMTPLEGVPMATRVGDVDAGIILALLGRGEFNSDELGRILTEESGLKALSGTTGDIKQLLIKRTQGDQAATLAIDIFCYRIRKYIGAYAVALGGLDALILTGTISERSAVIRAQICEPLAWLGVQLDSKKNEAVNEQTGGFIEQTGSAIRIAMFPTNELAEIARIIPRQESI